MVNVSVDPSGLPAAGLAAGEYYGRIDVKSEGASNSPQTITVVLSVLPRGGDPGPEVRPAGLVFTGAPGATPGSEDVQVGNPAGQAADYVSGPVGGAGLSYLPTNARVHPNQPTTLRVFPDFSDLSGGTIQQATITLQFSGGTSRTVSILMVAAPDGCTPSRLLPVFAQLGSGSSTPAGEPVTVTAKVVDDCGSPMTAGSVVASFSG